MGAVRPSIQMNRLKLGDMGGIDPSASQTEGYCPGTMIQIEIRIDQIRPADEEEEFEW